MMQLKQDRYINQIKKHVGGNIVSHIISKIQPTISFLTVSLPKMFNHF